jgi:hypothetical protein
MKLIKEEVEQVRYLTEESADGKKNYILEGIFLQAEKKNRNGRVYPREILAREVARYNQNYIQQKRAFGELGHPDSPTINLDRVSHMIMSLSPDGSNFVGRAKILDTPYGKIVKNLIDEGAQLGVSSRGLGSLRQHNGVQMVQDDFHLATAADIVADPSAPDAFVRGIMEGKEWVFQNGTFTEFDYDTTKKALNEARKIDYEDVKLRAFKQFLSKM